MSNVHPVPSTHLSGYEKQAAIVVFIAFLMWWLLRLLSTGFTGWMRTRLGTPAVVANGAVGVAQIENANTDMSGAAVNGGVGSANRASQTGFFGRSRGFFQGNTGGYDGNYGHYHTRSLDAGQLARDIFLSLGVTLLFVFFAQGGIPHVIHHLMWIALVFGELAVVLNLAISNRLFDIPLFFIFIALMVSIWSLGVLRYD